MDAPALHGMRTHPSEQGLAMIPKKNSNWNNLTQNLKDVTFLKCPFHESFCYMLLIIEVRYRRCWVSLHGSLGLGNVTLLLMVPAAYFLFNSRVMIFRWIYFRFHVYLYSTEVTIVLLIPEFYHTEAHFLSQLFYVLYINRMSGYGTQQMAVCARYSANNFSFDSRAFILKIRNYYMPNTVLYSLG